ncbi:coiled-coil domain-containing protein 40 [Ischnura elegans]|uniref:coiled-coil domain-containing protein 40 n=1 Tax=Ischnura elegans TaxID=197161 RepID=UPI001ED8A2F7|nr:coiled-coil domain-containing protein 40 [Ischnura elegans]XP_046404548.1 coiled-coil domain-containing protein 40 [Ischnura elegans]
MEQYTEKGSNMDTEAVNQNEGEGSLGGGLTLSPDHPLMKRFQDAMLLHLKQQEELLFTELKDLKANTNELQKKRESAGEELYNLQQAASKDQSILSNLQNNCSSLALKREEKEKNAKVLQGKLKAEVEKMNTEIKRERDLRHERDKLTALHKQFLEWKKEIESDIVVSQKVKNKTDSDKAMLIEEKQKLDLLMLKITIEFFKLKHRINELDTFTKIKQEEKETLEKTVADANAELQAITIEQNNLVKAWEGALLHIKQRDKIYFQLEAELRDLKLKISNMNGEIEGVKRDCAKEMEKNEDLTMIIGKTELYNENLKLEISKLNEKQDTLKLELSQMESIVQETEKSLQEQISMCQKLEEQKNVALKNIEKLTSKQVTLEDEIMETLQSQIVQDKSAKYLYKMITKLKDKVREQEVILVSAENNMANTVLAIEQQVAENERIKLNIQDLEAKVKISESNVKKAEDEFQRLLSSFGRKQNTVDLLNKKIDRLISMSGGMEKSSVEVKLTHLQEELKEINATSEELKVLWIRRQDTLLGMIQQKNLNLKNIDTGRKEILLLCQKKMKLKNEIENCMKEDSRIQRLIKNHQHKLCQLNLKISTKKEDKESMGKNNLLLQTDFVNSLKDAESEFLQLQTQLKELENKREELKEDLLSAQRTSLSWEKKIQMVVEAKQTLSKENSSDGDIHKMKGEIHRMQVRLGQLCQVQDRLASDLEKCVARREAITYAARIREKKAVAGATTSASQIQSQTSKKRKTEELQRHLKLLTLELKSIDQQISASEEQMMELHKKLIERQDRASKMKKAIDEIITDIAEKRMQKLQNLESLVRSQKLVRKYQDMKAGKYKPHCTSEAQLQTETQALLKTKEDIQDVIQKLKTDFPSHTLSLSRIEHTLEVSAL